MSDVNKQLLEALKELRDAYQEYMGLPACKANAAIAAAEQAPRWPQVDMGFGKFAVGSCTSEADGVPGLMYLRLDAPRPHNADCADVFPVGSQAPEDRIASIIHFHSAEALQQTIDVLLEIQSEHYPVAEQAKQVEPVARIKTVGGYHDDSRHELELLVKHGQLYDGQLLYAAAPQVAVPDGYALVPIEPTEEMFIDGMEADCLGRPSIDDETHVRGIWRAMLAAAQKGTP